MKQFSTHALKLFVIIFMLLCAYSGRAQYFTIPDTGLVTWFNNNGYAGCMNGNQLDTVCAQDTTIRVATLNFSNYGIADLTGIRYISWFTTQVPRIDCSHNRLTSVQPDLADKIRHELMNVYLDYNQIDTLNLDTINTEEGGMPYISATYNGMHAVISTKTIFYAEAFFLSVDHNNISSLSITNHGNDQYITLSHNLITHLTNSLQATYLNVIANQIDSVDPNAYYYGLYIDSNNLNTLTNTAYELTCSYNHLFSLTNTGGCYSIACNNNLLTKLDAQEATYVVANNNNISTLSPLSANLKQLNVSNNPLLQCIPSLGNVTAFELDFANTAVACLPRQYPWCTYTGTPGINTVPTCNLFNNIYGCPQYANLGGYTYFDTIAHCVFSSVEPVLPYVKALVSTGGNVQQQVYSDNTGHYSFNEINYGSYKLTVDTTNLPFTLQCPDSFNYVTTVDSQELYQNNFNFGFNCKPGFDVGVYGMSNNTWFHPGSTTVVTLNAGDMSAIYGLHCAAGISGQVTLSFFGPVTYVGMQGNSIAPTSVTSSSLTWNIADFGAVNPFTAFNVIFSTDTNAVNNQPVCLTAHVSPTAGDNNPGNNDGHLCTDVVVSFDPNGKEVYPAGMIGTSQQWLTYNIHFQNTGSATATNIYVLDTLDSNLDPLSFKLSGFNHQNVTEILPGGIVKFNFPFINLPDSLVSDSLSTGYIQYQVKLNPNLPAGTVISNTASIYFDYNAPVVTNTVHDTIYARSCPNTFDTLARAICQGDTFYVGTIAHTQAGSFTDTISNAGGCDSVVSLTLAVNALPLVTLSWDSMYADSMLMEHNGMAWWTFDCSGFKTVIVLSGGEPLGGHFSISGLLIDTLYEGHQYSPSADFIPVIYTYADTNNCTASAVDTIFLLMCEGIPKIANDNNITIYPNPATDQLFIKTENIQPVSISIYDVNGRMIYTLPFKPVVDVNELSSGVYFMEVKSEDGVARKRFVKM